MIELIYANYGMFLWIMTLTTVGLNIFNWWYISKAKMSIVYPLSMAVYLCYIIVETSLAFNNPEQISIMFYNITNVWAFAMSAKGYFRLIKERKNKEQT